ncbi:hypothetical protein EAE96_005348 [Botrytis aclada]|nr:hypothetical protein EAE96_005348 [Botrytis aclada]
MLELGGRTTLHSLAMAATEPEDRAAAKEILDALLAAGADLEARDSNGDTPLLLTVSDSHEYCQVALELLLLAGANPCVENSDGGTLLHRACKTVSSTDLASQLLAFGADPNQAQISDGLTPLHCVVDNISSPTEHLELLVKHGADINAQDINGDTILHRACRTHSIKSGSLIPTILSFVPDVNIQNKLDETCLHNICSNMDSELLGAILDTDINVEIYDRKGMSVLLRAFARYGSWNIKVVEALLKHPKKASISARTWMQGKTVLHLACHLLNSVELLKILISHGADLNWTDSMNGNTLLHEVAARFDGDLEDIALIEYLCESGISVNAKNYRRQTAAHIMGPVHGKGSTSRIVDVKQTFISVVRRLRPELGVNVKDMEGYTPLHYACATSESSVFALLMAGAELSVKSFNQRTPLHCAARGRQCSILSMLLNHAQNIGSVIDINAQDSDGMTPLHFACVSGRSESVSILISAGADINKKIKQANSQTTPLMACAMFPEEDRIWKMLQKVGSADLYLRDSFRVPPNLSNTDRPVYRLDDATQHITCRIGVIANMLIKAGADTANAIFPACYGKCAELVYAIRGGNFTKSKNFAESQLMAPMISIEKALDDCTSEDIVYLKNRVCELNEMTMECMIARGIDFTRVDKVGWMSDLGPPIAQFVHYGLTELMSKIISSAKLFDDSCYTDSLNDRWKIVRPLLHLACERTVWNMEMVKLLIEVGQVDTNAHQVTKERNNAEKTENIVKGKTALHILAKGDVWWQVEAIKYLGEHGAEVDILDDKGCTPLEVASAYTANASEIGRNFFRTKCCEALLGLGANPIRINPEGLTPLNKAGSDVDTINVLLRYGANVNGGMKCVLASAIECGDVKTLKLYLQNGADPNVPDKSTDSSYRAQEVANVAKKYPIILAALPKGYRAHSASIAAEMIQLLLDYGARVNLIVDEGETILHYLFVNATSSTLRPFFERFGIDMNIRDQSGRTILLSALSNSTQKEGPYPHVPPSKLDQPQPPYVRPHVHLVKSATHGPSLDYLAVDNEGRHIIFYLLSKWTPETTSLFLPIPGVRSLITQKDNEGYSPLHRALSSPYMSSLSNDVFIVNMLLNEGGADLLEPDPESNTALHYICRKYPSPNMADYFPLMNRFISMGGSIDARNNAGMTPLLLYLDAGGNLTHLPWYEEHGADFKAKNNEGEGALHMVAKHLTGTPSLSSGESEEGIAERHWFEVSVRKYGCEVLDEDSKGRTALDIAAAVGNEEILKLFQRRK